MTENVVMGVGVVFNLRGRVLEVIGSLALDEPTTTHLNNLNPSTSIPISGQMSPECIGNGGQAELGDLARFYQPSHNHPPYAQTMTPLNDDTMGVSLGHPD